MSYRFPTLWCRIEQVVFRIGTILGESVDNQIAALFDRRKMLEVAGSDSPFVFVWHTDVASAFAEDVTGYRVDIFNLAGGRCADSRRVGFPDEQEHGDATRLAAPGRPTRRAAIGFDGTRSGFLQYRPVLDNRRLEEQFGYVPEYSSEDAFAAYLASHRPLRQTVVEGSELSVDVSRRGCQCHKMIGSKMMGPKMMAPHPVILYTK
ncbi:hypothetical protein ACSW29_25060 [Rhodococcus sp. GB-02]